MPFPLIPLALSGISGVLGKWAGNRAQGRQAEATQTLSQDELRQRMWDAQTDRLLGRQRMINEAPNRLMDQTVRGDLLHNVQDVNIPDNARVRVAHYTGGIRPSALGANARQAGAAASALSLNQLQQPNFGIPDFPEQPNLSKMPQANWLDKFLGVATPALSLASVFAGQKNTDPFGTNLLSSGAPVPGSEGPFDPRTQPPPVIPTTQWRYPGYGGY